MIGSGASGYSCFALALLFLTSFCDVACECVEPAAFSSRPDCDAPVWILSLLSVGCLSLTWVLSASKNFVSVGASYQSISMDKWESVAEEP